MPSNSMCNLCSLNFKKKMRYPGERLKRVSTTGWSSHASPLQTAFDTYNAPTCNMLSDSMYRNGASLRDHFSLSDPPHQIS